ncbi:MAG: 4-alpha-glucanotransferase [Marinagarivorans sp.]|nr:4-alpha-glucanotransferase [Marinagarivorans sp.]
METLNQLMYWRGIASDYFNYKGEKVGVPLGNRKGLIRAMGVNPDDQDAVATQVYTLDVLPWTLWVPSFQVVEQHKQSFFSCNFSPADLDRSIVYTLILENGKHINGEFVPSGQPEVGDYVHQGARFSKRVIMCGALPLGYHSLRLSHEDKECVGEIAVVPEKSFLPETFSDAKKPWGFIVQLYTLTSDRNWGIGDLTDLKNLVKKSASMGAGIIGLNPLHALCAPIENNYSPYSPSDRRFIEPLYIDPECVPEFNGLTSSAATEIALLRAELNVNYKAVYKIKYETFRVMFNEFKEYELKRNTPRAQEFLSFIEREGAPLNEYCLYQVLRDEGIYNYSLSSLVLTNIQQDALDFYSYLQWLAQEQLSGCQLLAKELGMSIGLMRDLAVGADGSGAEVTSSGDLFCKAAAIGAPPDPMAEKGQNWGLPPMDPAKLRQTGFKHFINLLRTNMSHCGALRIDHAMGLMRLWWCPPGRTADFGAYVYYPFPEMLGLLKLESVRNKCMVIGEDMGVVPNEFREAIMAGAVFTNKLFYFERETDGAFKRPENYMPRSLAMLTNHDVPTLASWWGATDIELRNILHQLDDTVPLEVVLAERVNDKYRLLDWLASNGFEWVTKDRDSLVLLPLSMPLLAAIVDCGAKMASQIYVLQLDDLALIDEPVNVPGTSTEYANWQRKIGVSVSDLFSNEEIIKMLKNVSAIRN